MALYKGSTKLCPVLKLDSSSATNPFLDIPYNFMVTTDLEVLPFGGSMTANKMNYMAFLHPSAPDTTNENGDIYSWVKYTFNNGEFTFDTGYIDYAIDNISKFRLPVDNAYILNLGALTEIGTITNVITGGTEYLEKVYMPNVTKIGAIRTMFGYGYCPALNEVDLSSLSDISDGGTFGRQDMEIGAFAGTNLKTLSFPSLNSNSFGNYTNQFDGMLIDVTGCTVHFPSNLQSVIGNWTSVQNGFGGTNTTVLFDLPATT